MTQTKDLSQETHQKNQTPLFCLEQLEWLRKFTSVENKRKKSKKSWFRILNAIFLFSIRAHKNKMSVVCPSQFTLCKIANCSRSTLSEFINSPYFKVFCSVENRKRKTSIYKLKNQYAVLFSFLYKNGFMKTYWDDPLKWEKTFEKRLKKWLMPLLLEGYSLDKICSKTYPKCSKGMNKNASKVQGVTSKSETYEQKVDLKLDINHMLKLDTINTYGVPIKHSGYKTNIGIPPFAFGQMETLYRDLVIGQKIPEYEFNKFWKNYDGRMLMSCCRTMKEHTSGKWKPDKPVNYFQSLLTKNKKIRNKFQR